MKMFIQLWHARNKEFYRDKGSLSWAFIFPILIIFGCAFAFSSGDEGILLVGYPGNSEQQLLPETLKKPYIELIAYDKQERAFTRLRNHQLHGYLDIENKTLMTNPESSQSKLLTDLMINSGFKIEGISGKQVRYVDWVITGVLGMNIMFGSLFGVGYALVRYRKNGVLKRIHATPVTPITFLSAQVASRLFLVVSTNTLIFIGSDLLLDLVVEGSYLDLFLMAIIGAMSMISLGLLLASRTDSEEFAGGILNAMTWPMMFLSGIWFSLDSTPELMQQFAYLFPLTHLVDAGRDIMINGAGLADVWDHMLVMVLMTVIFLFLSAIMFRWHK